MRDFAAFAGIDGVCAAAFAVIGAAFESVGLVLLGGLLSIVTATDASPGWIHKTVPRFIDLLGAETRTARLSVLLGIFAALLVVRALAVARRDRTLPSSRTRSATWMPNSVRKLIYRSRLPSRRQRCGLCRLILGKALRRFAMAKSTPGNDMKRRAVHAGATAIDSAAATMQNESRTIHSFRYRCEKPSGNHIEALDLAQGCASASFKYFCGGHGSLAYNSRPWRWR